MKQATILAIIIVALVAIGVGVLISNNNSSQNSSLNNTNTGSVLGETTQTGNVKEFMIDAANYSFSPSAITVKKGDTVRITLMNTGGTHDLKIDEFNAASRKITTGQEDVVEFTADKAGIFEYYCSVMNHRARGMVGTLVVTE